MKKIIAVSFLVIFILFVSAIAGTIFYYNGIVNSENSKIASQNNEIANLASQISNITAQISNLTTANLVTALVVTEVGVFSPPNANYLSITGSVNNTGKGIAYNAGLHVVAYSAAGTVEINMTVPLTIDVEVEIGSSLQLGNLDAGQSATVVLDIYHLGTVTSWTITPVWTNSPYPP
jgi:hypothetical protein